MTHPVWDDVRPPAPTSVGAAMRALGLEFSDRVAIDSGTTQITFRELAANVARVAARIHANTPHEARVALLATQSVPTLITWFGIASAGRVVVPIDPRDPPERRAELMARAAVALGVCAEPPTVDPSDDPDSWILVDDLDGPRGAGLAPDPDPGAAAALYFTSGSTGAPKGVLRAHQVVLGSGRELAHSLRLGPGARVFFTFPISFLGGPVSAWAPWSVGATLCFIDAGSLGADALSRELATRRATVFSGVPSLVAAVADCAVAKGAPLTQVEDVTFGGDATTDADVARIRLGFPRARLQCVYGTQECGTIAVYLVPTPADPGIVPIGHPSPAFTVAIVDIDGRPCADGEVGELAAFGPRVALDYWENPIASAAAQVEIDGQIGMRTGDLARRRVDGVLVLVGRGDHRVKVSGQGVDLLEIEAELTARPEIAAAVVTALPDPRTGTRLVAHVAPRGMARVRAVDLRFALASRMPQYMIPRTFIVHDRLPSTVTGKPDRIALRDVALVHPISNAARAPRHGVERSVRTVMASVLALPDDEIGIDDDFFELGGDSLGATELVDAIAERFRLSDTARAGLEAVMLRSATAATLAQTVLYESAERVETTVRGTSVIGIVGTARARPHLFCQAGSGRAALSLRPLAERLDAAALSTFWPPGFTVRGWPHRSVTTWARGAIEAMRRVQPEGPYFLGGHSFGGLIAYEMARQLTNGREHVALVVLIDTPVVAPAPEYPNRLRRIQSKVLDEPDHVDRAGRWQRSARRAAQLLDERARRALPELVVGLDPEPARRYVALEHVATGATNRYRIDPYTGAVLLVHATELEEPSDLGWRRVVTGPLDVVRVHGDHGSVLRAPWVNDLARVIDRAIVSAR